PARTPDGGADVPAAGGGDQRRAERGPDPQGQGRPDAPRDADHRTGAGHLRRPRLARRHCIGAVAAGPAPVTTTRTQPGVAQRGWAGPRTPRPPRRLGARLLRDLSLVLVISGLLMLADAGVTLLWQEPLSAAIALIEQGNLDRRLLSYRDAPLSRLDLQALA